MNNETREMNQKLATSGWDKEAWAELEKMIVATFHACNERSKFNHSDRRLFLILTDDGAGLIAYCNAGDVVVDLDTCAWAIGPTPRELVHVNDWLNGYAEAQKETWASARCDDPRG